MTNTTMKRDAPEWVDLARARGFITPDQLVRPEPGEPTITVLGVGRLPVRAVEAATRAADKARADDLDRARPRQLDTYAFDCPQCEAVAGQPCWSAAGYPTDSHRRRVTARTRYNRKVQDTAERSADETWSWVYSEYIRTFLEAYGDNPTSERTPA